MARLRTEDRIKHRPYLSENDVEYLAAYARASHANARDVVDALSRLARDQTLWILDAKTDLPNKTLPAMPPTLFGLKQAGRKIIQDKRRQLNRMRQRIRENERKRLGEAK